MRIKFWEAIDHVHLLFVHMINKKVFHVDKYDIYGVHYHFWRLQGLMASSTLVALGLNLSK